MSDLNYHHLRYFREIAHDGQLTRTADRLNVAQSSLSAQIKTLEARLGHDLFHRKGRTLHLTEAGRIALEHADRIFGAGDELLATLAQTGAGVPPLKVGALSTLSRNFQMQFLESVLADQSVPLTLKSGQMEDLLTDLETMALDVVLTTDLPPTGTDFAAQRIAQQAVGLHGQSQFMRHESLEHMLAAEPLIVPSGGVIQHHMQDLFTRLGVTPTIAAVVDDMAMVRLLARSGIGIAVAPAVVLADEIASGLIQSAPFVLDIFEPFYAVTVARQFPHPALKTIKAPEPDA